MRVEHAIANCHGRTHPSHLFGSYYYLDRRTDDTDSGVAVAVAAGPKHQRAERSDWGPRGRTPAVRTPSAAEGAVAAATGLDSWAAGAEVQEAGNRRPSGGALAASRPLAAPEGID